MEGELNSTSPSSPPLTTEEGEYKLDLIPAPPLTTGQGGHYFPAEVNVRLAGTSQLFHDAIMKSKHVKTLQADYMEGENIEMLSTRPYIFWVGAQAVSKHSAVARGNMGCGNIYFLRKPT